MGIYEYLKELSLKKDLPMHMPGHKRNADAFPYLEGCFIDYTETASTDNLHDPQGIIALGEQQLSELYGSKESYYGVNGSTGCILAAIRALTSFGDEVLVARNCHKSVYHAIEICGLKPTYLFPHFMENCDIFSSVDVEETERLLSKGHFSLVILTSPTYEGVLSDTKRIYEICKANGAFLLVDAAHGAHLPFFMGASSYGDVVVQSFHKTLPSLTQSAVLHVFGEKVDRHEVERQLQIFETSSPSYLLMSSIDGTVQFLKHSQKAFEEYRKNLALLRNKLSNLTHLTLLDSDAVFGYDEGKIVFLLNNVKENGEDVLLLFEKQQVVLEMAGYDYVLAMTSVADTKETFERFYQACLNVDAALTFREKKSKLQEISFPKQIYTPFEALSLEKKAVSFSSKEPFISGCYISLYPPGVPLALPGELIDSRLLSYMNHLEKEGFHLSVSGELKKINENFENIQEKH